MERRTRAANPRSGGDSPVALRTQRRRVYTDTRCGSLSATHGAIGIETRGAARAYCACSIGTASTQQAAKPTAPSSLRSMAAIIALVDTRNATVYAIPLNKISGGFSTEYRSHGLRPAFIKKSKSGLGPRMPCCCCKHAQPGVEDRRSRTVSEALAL